MHDPHIREFRLAGPQGDGLHAYLNDEGAFIGFGTPLVEKDHSGTWRPRPLAELDTMLKIGYDDPVPAQRRMGNLEAVARALNKGDRALAAILLVHAEFPPLPDRFAAERMNKAYLLDKDYNPDQPRVPAGNSDGGQWTREGGDGGTKPIRVADSDAIMADAGGNIVVAQEDDETREDEMDPMAEVRQAEHNNKLQTLEALNPGSYLSEPHGPDWVPTQQDLDQLDQLIQTTASKRVTDFIAPGGRLIGTRGTSQTVRELPGGLSAAQQAFDYLKVGGEEVSRSTYEGTLVKLPGDVGFVGLRPNSSDGSPALDIRMPGRYIKIHYQ
jgi:hypothetical protein